MSTLYTCYSPKGEKFELSKANYMDVTTHHGFTTTPPSDVIFDEIEELEDEIEELEDELDAADEAEFEAEFEAEIEDAEDEVVIEQEALSFENATDAKAYLRGKGVQFDGRLSLADLTDLANGKVAE